MTHTPGPFAVREYHGGHGCVVEGPHGVIVARCQPAFSGPYDLSAQEAAANARLFSAAPDLLKAAKMLVAAVWGRRESQRTDHALQAAEKALRAAIAKAEGK